MAKDLCSAKRNQSRRENDRRGQRADDDVESKHVAVLVLDYETVAGRRITVMPISDRLVAEAGL